MPLHDTVCPGCPPLSYFIAKEICNPHASTDKIISIDGKKGSGKSTLSLALAESISENIARLKGGKPEDYFTIDNVVSIQGDGALELLSSGKLQRMNQVFVLDDAGTMWSNRRSMSFLNQALNEISTISRVYECCLIVNMVSRGTTDLVLRNLTDVSIRMYSKNTQTKTALSKAYIVEHRADGSEILKYLTWKPQGGEKRRLKWMLSGLPTPALNKAYKELRRKSTDEHIQAAREKLQEMRGEKEPDKKTKTANPNIEKFKDTVGKMYDDHVRTTDIVLKTGLSRYWVEKCIAAHLNGGNDDV